jgi:hypothetical protein
VVARDHQQRPPKGAQKRGRPLVFQPPAAVRQVARDDDQLGLDSLDQRLETALHLRFFRASGVQIRDVEEAQRQRRSRLYTEFMADESTEIFDDLYLGLRAGGALRKQRRGEPLTTEEQEALGRWERLSPVRKALAIGAFAVGTFGLGFTLGGLIFGRWRKA